MSLTASGDANASAAASADDVDLGDFFVDLDGLQTHGINVADIKKLKAAGICTVRGLK